jgi:hypothetical protein
VSYALHAFLPAPRPNSFLQGFCACREVSVHVGLCAMLGLPDKHLLLCRLLLTREQHVILDELAPEQWPLADGVAMPIDYSVSPPAVKVPRHHMHGTPHASPQICLGMAALTCTVEGEPVSGEPALVPIKPRPLGILAAGGKKSKKQRSRR